MLTVKDLHKSYQVGTTTYEVLKGISLSVDQGEFVAIMGPSGSGKTTLLNCISCYIPSDSGSILLGETELAKLDEEALAEVRNKELGFVFQDFLLLDGLSVRENILLPSIIGGTVNEQVEARADQLCEVFGLSHIKAKYPAEISGGEKQRTAVARALINQPLHPAMSADTGFPVRQHRIPSANACIPLLGGLGGNDDPPSDHVFLPSSSITTEFDWQQTTRQA